MPRGLPSLTSLLLTQTKILFTSHKNQGKIILWHKILISLLYSFLVNTPCKIYIVSLKMKVLYVFRLERALWFGVIADWKESHSRT